MSIFKKTIFFIGVFSIFFFLYHQQTFKGYTKPKYYGSDIGQHVSLAKKLEAGQVYIPHSGFHITLIGLRRVLHLDPNNTAVILLSLATLLIALIIHYILTQSLPLSSENLVLFLTAAAMLVSPIYVPFFNEFVYRGQGHPNLWHSPTYTMMRPFAMLSFFLFVRLLGAEKHQKSLLYSAVLALMLVISTVMKPNFVVAFIPSLALFLLVRYFGRWKLYLRSLAIIVPTLIVLTYQFLRARHEETCPEVGLVLDYFRLWRSATRSVPISILITIAFPLSLFILNFKRCFRSDGLVLAWILYVIALVQYGMLNYAEPPYSRVGLWIWGYIIALAILFLFSVTEFVGVLRALDESSRIEKFKAAFVSVLFSLHLASGTFYLASLLCGKYYA